jgi:predicted RNase H-like nuclease (RuvC/YqgF family)
VSGGQKTVTLLGLYDILPSRYFGNLTKVERADLGKTCESLQIQDDGPKERAVNHLIQPVRVQEESPNSDIVPLENEVQELRNELAKFECSASQQKDSSNAIIRSLRADLYSQETNTTNLETTIQELRNQLTTFQCASNQEKNSLNETINSLRADLRAEHQSSNNKIAHLEQTNRELRVQLQHKADSLIRISRAHEQKHQCELLYAQGRIYDAAESLLQMTNTVNDDMRGDKLIFDWLAGEFRRHAFG